MERFSIHSTFNGPVTDSLPLFYKESYRQLIVEERQHFFYQSNDGSSFHLFASRNENNLVSLNYSPFGTIYYEGNTKALLPKFIDHIRQYMGSNGFKSLILNHPAPFYKNLIDLDSLIACGFTLVRQEDHQFIDLKKPQTLHVMEQRKLEKLYQQHVQVKQIERDEWQNLFEFIAACRIEKGLTINIELQRLLQLKNQFPDAYTGWIATDRESWVAGLITVQVTDEVVYYYLPATPASHQKMSPMVMLLHETTNYFRTKNINYYDLGISSLGGERQEGLFQFKSRMGAKNEHRITLQLIP